MGEVVEAGTTTIVVEVVGANQDLDLLVTVDEEEEDLALDLGHVVQIIVLTNDNIGIVVIGR